MEPFTRNGNHTAHRQVDNWLSWTAGDRAALKGCVKVFLFSLLSSLEFSDAKVYEPCMRALLGTASHFCEVVVLKLRTRSASASLALTDYSQVDMLGLRYKSVNFGAALEGFV